MADNRFGYRKSLILNMIHHLGPISRTELIALTDYRPATVGEIVTSLLDEKLVVEAGQISGGHGRKRVMLELNRTRLCALGISFVSGKVQYILGQPDGVLLYRSETPIPQGIPRHILADCIADEVEKILHQFEDKHIVGIGICNPLSDPRSYEAGVSLSNSYSLFNNWILNSLQPRLAQLSGLNVKTFSNVTLPVVAEHRFGVAKGVEDFLWVELSNGIGASIFAGGNPIGGARGVAGELGHTVVDCHDRSLCYCGKPGCVERTTAFPSLVAQIRQALDSGVFSLLRSRPNVPEYITVEDIRWALEQGDRMCMHLVEDAAAQIGVAIANAVNLLNPKLVVLYGFMLELGEHFLKPLEHAIREHTITLAEDFEIRLSNSLESLLPWGAVAELFSDFLGSENYRWVYRLTPGDTEIKEN